MFSATIVHEYTPVAVTVTVTGDALAEPEIVSPPLPRQVAVQEFTGAPVGLLAVAATSSVPAAGDEIFVILTVEGVCPGAALIVLDAALSPTALRALTEQDTAALVLGKLTTMGDVLPVVTTLPHVAQYSTTGRPPVLVGGEKDSVSAPPPGVIPLSSGADGTPITGTGAAVAAWEEPLASFAVTLQE